MRTTYRVTHLTHPQAPRIVGDVLCGTVNRSEIYSWLKQTRDRSRVTCQHCLTKLAKEA